MVTCGNGFKVCGWLAARQSSAAVRRQVLPPLPVSLPPPPPPTHSGLQHPLQAEECARRVVLAERRHLRRALDRRGLPSGAVPRALIRADVKWVWALREGPDEDEEGARCAAGALRPQRALLPGAADPWPARLAEPAHAAAALPALGRVPRRPWGLAGAAAGALQVCPRAVTFGRLGGCWVGRAQGAFVPGRWRVGSGFVSGCGQRRGSRSALLEFHRENSLSWRPALVTPRQGRRGSCLVVWRIGSLSAACVYGNRVISHQRAQLPEMGCSWGTGRSRAGGLGRGAPVTRSRPARRGARPSLSSLWGAGYGGGKGSASRR